MMDNKFTVLELIDLALVVPEVGAVNFNILHTVLRAMAVEMKIEHFKPLCYIQDPVGAQNAITKAKLLSSPAKRPMSATSLREMKDRMKTVVVPKLADETIAAVDSMQKPKEGTSTETTKPVGQEPSDEDTGHTSPIEPTGTVIDAVEEAMQQTDEDGALVIGIEQDGVPRVSIREVHMDTTDEAPPSTDREMSLTQQEGRPFAGSAPGRVFTAEELQSTDPTKLMTEIWRATNINRRMDGAENGLREIASNLDILVDRIRNVESNTAEIMEQAEEGNEDIKELGNVMEEKCDTLQQLMEDTNEEFKQEAARIKDLLEEFQLKQQEANEAIRDELGKLEAEYAELAANVVLKADFEDFKDTILNDVAEQIKTVKRSIKDLRDVMISKEAFAELVQRIDVIEEDKISRSELGPLMEPGFIENLVDDIRNLKEGLKELTERLNALEEILKNLIKRIDEEIVVTIETHHTELIDKIGQINDILKDVDFDEIYDNIGDLGVQFETFREEVETVKTSSEQREQEVKRKLHEITAITVAIDRLKETKADITRVKELLDVKADVEILMGKLDANEFFTVMTETRGSIDRLGATVTLNEEKGNENFEDIRRELTLKMYSEDFLTATEPINNRIKALIYGQKKVKEIARSNLYPGAFGISKCVSCGRGAELAGTNYQSINDNDIHGGGEAMPQKDNGRTGRNDEQFVFSLPDVENMTNMKVPTSEKPKVKDPLHLPYLFAAAKPNVGLAHQVPRRVIDRETRNYFATRPIRSCGGPYTKTRPQQAGVGITNIMLPLCKKSDVILQGADKNMYKGLKVDYKYAPYDVPITKEVEKNLKETEIASLKQQRRKKGFIEPVYKSLQEKQADDSKSSLIPSVVSLCVNNEIVDKESPLVSTSSFIGLPTEFHRNVMKSRGLSK